MEKVFSLDADSGILRDLRREMRGLLEAAGWEKKNLEEIVLSVDEAMTNVIRHAYCGQAGKIKLVFRDIPEKTEIIIEDTGKKFDPTTIPEPKLPREKPGGLGVHFIRTIMDEMIYDKDFESGNRLHMIKRKLKS